jgi:hypothetical protein
MVEVNCLLLRENDSFLVARVIALGIGTTPAL